MMTRFATGRSARVLVSRGGRWRSGSAVLGLLLLTCAATAETPIVPEIDPKAVLVASPSVLTDATIPINQAEFEEQIRRLASSCAIRYMESCAELILKARQYQGPSIELVLLSIATRGDERIVVCFSDWPSHDLQFNFYRESGRDCKHIGSIYGTEIFVANGSFAYVSGHSNDYVGDTKLVRLTPEKVEEAPASERYVGVSAKTTASVVLYTSPDTAKREPIATVPKGESVELLLRRLGPESDENELRLFAKLATGMVGWICIDKSDLDEGKSPIDAVYFRGD